MLDFSNLLFFGNWTLARGHKMRQKRREMSSGPLKFVHATKVQQVLELQAVSSTSAVTSSWRILAPKCPQMAPKLCPSGYMGRFLHPRARGQLWNEVAINTRVLCSTLQLNHDKHWHTVYIAIALNFVFNERIAARCFFTHRLFFC